MSRRAGHGYARTDTLAVVCCLALVGVAVLVPFLFTWDVGSSGLAPLHAEWQPHVGPGTALALVIGLVAVVWAPRAALRLRWGWLLIGSWVASLAWMVSLALVDGRQGLGAILATSSEYLGTVAEVDSIPALLEGYIDRIPLDSPDNWPVHVAGHPPGAVLFFVGLARLGIDTWWEVGLVVIACAATLPAAVMLVVRTLASEDLARTAAPFLVFTPAAIWLAVSADGVFAAVTAWGAVLLAVAGTTVSRPARVVLGLLAGAVLGLGVFLSYGLVLFAFVALALVVLTRRWSLLVWGVLGALLLVGVFAWGGFLWWEAYPVLHERYWDGLASVRPYSYWVWGNLAALVCATGPVLGPSLLAAFRGVRRRVPRPEAAPSPSEAGLPGGPVGTPVGVASGASESGPAVHAAPAAPVTRVPIRVDPAHRRTVGVLVLAALLAVLVADLSAMSKSEVERIWLPFVPWLLAGTALFSRRTIRPMLVLQIVTALVLQHMFLTGW